MNVNHSFIYALLLLHQQAFNCYSIFVNHTKTISRYTHISKIHVKSSLSNMNKNIIGNFLEKDTYEFSCF